MSRFLDSEISSGIHSINVQAFILCENAWNQDFTVDLDAD